MWRLARSSTLAHLGSSAGTAVVIALASALLTVSGVLIESGLRAPQDPSGVGGANGLFALASSFIGTALVVVALVVAATVTLALRPRQREFGVLRALGATRQQIRRMVAAELVLLTAVTAPIGAVPGLAAAHLMTPLLVEAGMVPPSFTLTLSPLPVLNSVILLAAVATVAAYLATRETLRLPPTAAVSAALAEPRELGRTRRVLALVTAIAGVGAAGTPLVVPGTVGGATAASSALLLIGAAALAGPLLVAWALGTPPQDGASARRPMAALAVANARGFSRRLTAVIVPLAAVIAVGTVQTSTGSAMEEAATQQLRAGLHPDLVVTEAGGFDVDRVRQVDALSGVRAATPLAALTFRVLTDDEIEVEALAWETFGARVLPGGSPPSSYDPGVIDGSLDALERPDTVAVSTDTRLLTGSGLGDTVTADLGDGPTTLDVVAVYDRGLGFGDYTLGGPTLLARGDDRPADTLLISTDDPDAVTSGLSDLGLEPVSTDTYIERATSVGASEQRLSSMLLLALLGFMLVGAANALVMLTSGRRSERDVLTRIGATRPQLLRLALAESVVTAVAAITIGTVAVVPAILGVTLGLLGPSLPAIDLTTYAVLLTLVVATSVLSTVATVTARTRPSRSNPSAPS